MHFNHPDYDSIIELIIYFSEGDDYPEITQIWSANHAHPYALRKLLNNFECLIPLDQIINIGQDKFIKAIFSFNKTKYRYFFERLEEINEYQEPIYYLH